MGSFTLKVAGDEGFYSVQEAGLFRLAKRAVRRLDTRVYRARSFEQVRLLGRSGPMSTSGLLTHSVSLWPAPQILIHAVEPRLTSHPLVNNLYTCSQILTFHPFPIKPHEIFIGNGRYFSFCGPRCRFSFVKDPGTSNTNAAPTQPSAVVGPKTKPRLPPKTGRQAGLKRFRWGWWGKPRSPTGW